MLSYRSHLLRGYKSNASLISLGILVVLLTRGTIGLAFPTEHKTELLQRIADITPKSPSSSDESRISAQREQCDDNMILEEFNSTTTFCECARGYLYYPNLDKCYRAYKRGPCDEGHLLILRANQMIAECIVNPCKKDNEVLYMESCHGLLSEGPCPADMQLVISETTFQPTCERIRFRKRRTITAPTKSCGPGLRRAGR